MTDFDTRRAVLTMPYYYHFDDQFFALFPRAGTGLEHADTLAANWRAELDAQYRRGRFFQMTLHPHAVGWCNRLEVLQRFLGDLDDYPGSGIPPATSARVTGERPIHRRRICDWRQASGRTIREA